MNTRPFALLCAALVVAGGGCAETESAHDQDASTFVVPGGKADIYGSDSRAERYEAGALYRQLGESTAVVVGRGQIAFDGNNDMFFDPRTWNEKQTSELGGPLCTDEPFRDQPAPGFCSAFLIAPDLVATAGHCININQLCGEVSFIFDYAYDFAGDPDLNAIPGDDFYRCDAVVGHLYDKGAQSLADIVNGTLWSDWAVVRLDRPVVGREPLQLRRSGSPDVGDLIVAIGHPGGIPSKVTEGRITEINSELFVNTDLDIYAGNSGSVAVNRNGEVEGIVIRGTGGASFVNEGTCFGSRECANFGDTRCTGNHVMRVEPLLQFADARDIVTRGEGIATGDAPIVDGRSISRSLTVSDGGEIRFVTVNAGVWHDNPKDLKITLTRDSGESAVLIEHSPVLPPAEAIASHTSNAFDGQDAAGVWTLTVEDTVDNGGSNQSLWFWQINVGIGDAVVAAPTATFIGSPCVDSSECTFDPSATCHTWDDGGETLGVCTVPCDGYCPDRAGFATTFCTSLDGGISGSCVARSHALNSYCTAIPGTVQLSADRFVGTSSASPSLTNVCLPR